MIPPGRPRLLALDVDGTLLDEQGRLRDQVRDALRAVLTAGVQIVLCSGRSLTTLPRLAHRIAPDLPLIAFNGAATLSSSGRLERLVTLPVNLAAQAIRAARDVGNEPFVFVHPDQPGEILAQRTCPDSCDYLLYNTDRVTWVASLPDALTHPPIELTCMFRDGAAATRLESALSRELGPGAEIIRAYNPANDFWSLSIHGPGANKADALRDYLQRQKVPPDQVWAAGDGINDLGILALAGRSFAMGNAPEPVRQAADETLPPHTEVGILELLHRLTD